MSDHELIQKAIKLGVQEAILALGHEIKRPLARVIAAACAAKIVFGEKLDSESIECYNMIEDSAAELSKVISTVLDTYAKHSELERELFNLSEQVGKIVNDIKADSDTYQRVVFKLDNDMSCNGNLNMINTVFRNLVENACKYCQAEDPIVEIGCDNDVYYIKDNGIGFSGEDAGKIFDMHVRGENAKLLNIKGTGIGLNVVKNIIELHGGEIWAEGKPNEGCTISFTL